MNLPIQMMAIVPPSGQSVAKSLMGHTDIPCMFHNLTDLVRSKLGTEGKIAYFVFKMAAMQNATDK